MSFFMLYSCCLQLKLSARDYITSIVYCLCHGQHMRIKTRPTNYVLPMCTPHTFLFIMCFVNLVDDAVLLVFTFGMLSKLTWKRCAMAMAMAMTMQYDANHARAHTNNRLRLRFQCIFIFSFSSPLCGMKSIVCKKSCSSTNESDK